MTPKTVFSALHPLASSLAVATLLIVGVGCKDEPAAPPVSVSKPVPLPDAKPLGTALKTGGPDLAPDAGPAAPVLPTEFAEPTPEQTSLIASVKKALEAGNNGAATQALETLAKSKPMSGLKLSGVIALSDMRLAEGNTDGALALLTAAQAESPPTAELEFVLGRTYKSQSKTDDAIKHFSKALELQPLLLHVHVELGGLHASAGATEKSAASYLAYERAVYKYAKILEDPQSAIEDKLKVVESFSLLPDDRANESLVAAALDGDASVRYAAVTALGEVGTRATLPELEKVKAKAIELGDTTYVGLLDQTMAKISKSPAEPMVDTEGQGGLGPTFVDAGTKPTEGDAGTGDAGVKP